MFGIGFVKVPPTTYLMAFRAGRVVREGAGLSFFYYKPTTSLVAVPVGSRAQDFIFDPVTADFQAITVQGQVSWRIGSPRQIAGLLDYTLRGDGRTYDSEDPQKLIERVLGIVKVLVQKSVKALPLKSALLASDEIASRVHAGLAAHPEVVSLGLEILSVSVLAVKPTPDTARALEAEAREAILRLSDEAIYERRNAAVAQERSIRESELDTEVAVEQKKRTIRETQMEAEASIRRKKHELRAAEMQSDIEVEGRRREFVALNAGNIRTLAEAEAEKVGALARVIKDMDPRLVQALAAIGMEPSQLIAQAFHGLAENAGRIGQLNVSPDLLDSLMRAPRRAEAIRAGQK
jgi:hypothetical protein